MRNNFSQLATLTSKNVPFVIGAIGLIFLLSSLGIEYSKLDQKRSTNTFTATESGVFSRKILKIDIEGAVERPGIYEIPDDSRIQDVLISAGGMTAKANRTMVSKDIKLAQRVYDGQKIYIPEIGDSNLVTQSPSNSIKSININTATEAELDTLSGVGPVTVKKIVEGRPYQNISQLLEKHLVSSSVYDKIKNSITTY